MCTVGPKISSVINIAGWKSIVKKDLVFVPRAMERGAIALASVRGNILSEARIVTEARGGIG